MDATPQPSWPSAAPAQPAAATPARPASTSRAPAAATLVAVALAGVLVGFGGSQALDHSSLASNLARVGGMLSGGAAASAPVVTSSTAGSTGSGSAPAASSTNPAPARNPAGRQAPAGNQAPAAAGQPANSQDQAAIQQAIQGIDDAQVKAVSSNDLSGLSANATSDFAAQQKSTTQDLLDNGVTEIKLDNIEWGPITVNGNTATATATETWSTTYSDSSTEQSRDRNVYTLVQQNGSWVVQADEHPDAFPAGGLQGIPGLPNNNVVPPGFPNPFQNPAPRSQRGPGTTTPPVQAQP
jgi:ketosteroid isomerase-like protein